MYHYDPQTALEDLGDDAVLPNPVHVRDMMIRTPLSPSQALELNRKLQAYMQAFGAAQAAARALLEELVLAARKE